MTEEEARDEATKVIDRHRIWARPMVAEDFIELKKYIRLAQIMPAGGQRHLLGFKDFHQRYGHWVFTHLGTEIFNKIMDEVHTELIVDPPSQEELRLVADLAIKVAMYGPYR